MSKEAMKLALEALENNRQTHYYCEDTWYSCPKHEEGCANESEGDECNCGADKANVEIDGAIIALREALAKPDFWEGYVPEPDKRQQALDKKAENARELGLDYEPAQKPVACANGCSGFVKHPPPAQQEPVAWLDLLREARDNCKASIVEEGISASRKEYRIDLEARLTAALNTSPPAQRTWVELTDDDIDHFCHLAYTGDEELVLTIQARLKEKNA